MTVDPPFIDASSGSPSYSGSDLRLGLLVPMFAGAGSSLGVRTGIRPSGSGLDLLVQAQSTPNMSVKVNPGSIIVQGAISSTQGAYTWTLDTLTTLTISAAHATLARVDLVAVRIRDANVDTSGQRDGAVVVITGTAGGGVPSLPTDATYLTLAQVAVAAAVTSIVNGNITNIRTFTAALGGVIPANSATEPSAASMPIHQIVCRTDLGNVFRAPDGSGGYKMVGPYRTTNVLSGTTASVTFSGLPAGLKTATIKVTARGDAAALTGVLCLRVNGDTGSNYFGIQNKVTNATYAASNYSAQGFAAVGNIACASASANQFGQATIDIAGISQSSHFTNFTYRSITYPTQASSIHETGGGVYAVAGPYTSFTLLPLVGSFVSGSEFTLEAWDY